MFNSCNLLVCIFWRLSFYSPKTRHGQVAMRAPAPHPDPFMLLASFSLVVPKCGRILTWDHQISDVPPPPPPSEISGVATQEISGVATQEISCHKGSQHKGSLVLQQAISCFATQEIRCITREIDSNTRDLVCCNTTDLLCCDAADLFCCNTSDLVCCNT